MAWEDDDIDGVDAGVRASRVKVRAYKVGADFVDPMAHRAALREEGGGNLDGYLIGEAAMRREGGGVRCRRRGRGDGTVRWERWGERGWVDGADGEVITSGVLLVVVVPSCSG